MPRRFARWVLAMGLLSMAAVADGPPLTGGDFTIRRSTIDAGGGDSVGGEFSLRGTIGQADAGQHGGGGFSLRGGFWTVEGQLPDVIFDDGFEG